jgi:hypothetical protein
VSPDNAEVLRDEIDLIAKLIAVAWAEAHSTTGRSTRSPVSIRSP